MKKVKDTTQDSEYNYMSEKNDVFTELANVNTNDVTNNIELSLINGVTNDERYDYICAVRASTLNHNVPFYIDVMYRLHLRRQPPKLRRILRSYGYSKKW